MDNIQDKHIYLIIANVYIMLAFFQTDELKIFILFGLGIVFMLFVVAIGFLQSRQLKKTQALNDAKGLFANKYTKPQEEAPQLPPIAPQSQIVPPLVAEITELETIADKTPLTIPTDEELNKEPEQLIQELTKPKKKRKAKTFTKKQMEKMIQQAISKIPKE